MLEDRVTGYRICFDSFESNKKKTLLGFSPSNECNSFFPITDSFTVIAFTRFRKPLQKYYFSRIKQNTEKKLHLPSKCWHHQVRITKKVSWLNVESRLVKYDALLFVRSFRSNRSLLPIPHGELRCRKYDHYQLELRGKSWIAIGN